MYTYQPNPILLDFGIIRIHWYGLILAVAMISGFLVALVRLRPWLVKPRCFKSPVKDLQSVPLSTLGYGGQALSIEVDFVVNLLFWTTIWGLIGGRLIYILTFLNYYLQNPLEVFYIWQGGISFYGVFIFGLASLLYFSKKLLPITNYQLQVTSYFKQRLINFLFLSDIAVVGLSLAQSIGRWGNWFNQEIFGPPCNWAWCIPIDFAHRPLEYLTSTHFHPVFLYESAAMLLLFIFLFKMYKRLCFPPVSSGLSSVSSPREPLVRTPAGSGGDINSEKNAANNNVTIEQCNNENILYKAPGVIFIMYLILHSLVRFILEFLRLDPQPILLGLRLFQWFALVEFIFGILLFVILKKWYNKNTGALKHLNT